MVRVTFAVDQNLALNLATAASLVGGVPSALDPSGTQETWLMPLHRTSHNDAVRVSGLALLGHAAISGALAQTAGTSDAKRKVLIGNGLMWGALAAKTGVDTNRRRVKRRIGIGATATQAALAGLCLWKGFEGKRVPT